MICVNIKKKLTNAFDRLPKALSSTFTFSFRWCSEGSDGRALEEYKSKSK